MAASVSADGDTFELAYSTDGQIYTPMLVVRGTGSPQDVVYPLPSDLRRAALRARPRYQPDPWNRGRIGRVRR